MLNLTEMKARLEADNVIAKMSTHTRLWNHANATFTPPAGQLFPEAKQPQATTELARIKRQVRSMGAEVLETKKTAALGSVTSADETLNSKYEMLAERLFEAYFIRGVMAAFPYIRASDGMPLVESLEGYLAPYFDKDDQRLTGLYQAKCVDDKNGQQKYWVRVFDFEDQPENKCTVRTWYALAEPTHLAFTPDDTVEGAERPVITFEPPDDDGDITSKFRKHMPLLESIYTLDVYLKRAEMFAGFPVAVIKGNVHDTTNLMLSPASPIQLDADGSFEWAEPGNLNELRTSKSNAIGELRNALNLPGSFQSQAVASGVAIREFNTGFNQDASRDANRIEKTMNEALEGLQRLTGQAQLTVSVSPNLEYIREQQQAFVLEWYKEGIIPREQAMRVAKLFLNTWEDDEFQRDVNAPAESNPESVLSSFGDEER